MGDETCAEKVNWREIPEYLKEELVGEIFDERHDEVGCGQGGGGGGG